MHSSAATMWWLTHTSHCHRKEMGDKVWKWAVEFSTRKPLLLHRGDGKIFAVKWHTHTRTYTYIKTCVQGIHLFVFSFPMSTNLHLRTHSHCIGNQFYIQYAHLYAYMCVNLYACYGILLPYYSPMHKLFLAVAAWTKCMMYLRAILCNMCNCTGNHMIVTNNCWSEAFQSKTIVKLFFSGFLSNSWKM